MNVEWKVVGSISSTGKPVLIVKIRTEHEIIISPDSLDRPTKLTTSGRGKLTTLFAGEDL